MEILGPDAKNALRWFIEPKWKIALYVIAFCAIYFIPEHGPSVLGMAALELGLLGHVIGLQVVFGLVSWFLTLATHWLFFGKHTETVTPLASAFAKTEGIFDAEHDAQEFSKTYSQNGLQFLSAAAPVVLGRTLATVIIFSVYMWGCNSLMVILTQALTL